MALANKMSGVEMEQYLDLSDLSDKEDAEQLDLSQFLVEWFDLSDFGFINKLGICSLPGCKYKTSWRSLSFDIKCLKECGVEDIFCFCTKGELHLYRVQDLIRKYEEAGFTVHHYPIEDGGIPETDTLLKILDELRTCLISNKKTLLHCYGGLGRSCLVTMCLSIYLGDNISAEEVRDKIKNLRGEKAFGSVKQYNYVSDFRETLDIYRKNDNSQEDDRSASR